MNVISRKLHDFLLLFKIVIHLVINVNGKEIIQKKLTIFFLNLCVILTCEILFNELFRKC